MGVRTPPANEDAIPTHEDFRRDETSKGSSNRTLGFVIAALGGRTGRRRGAVPPDANYVVAIGPTGLRREGPSPNLL